MARQENKDGTAGERTVYHHGSNVVVVEVEDTPEHFRWRLTVDGKISPWTTHYSGLLVHEGYAVGSGYWGGSIEEFVPFKLDYAKEAQSGKNQTRSKDSRLGTG